MEAIKKINAMEDINKKSKNFVTDDGNIYILGEFDSTISTEVIYAVVSLIEHVSTRKDPELNIYINSYGGDAYQLFSLLSVLDMARKRGIRINTHVIGAAYSAGSLLAVYGDRRTMSKFSEHLLHLGSSGSIFSTLEQLRRETENSVKHFGKIFQIYQHCTKIPKKKLEEMLKDDKMYLDPAQCLKYGICDEVV